MRALFIIRIIYSSTVVYADSELTVPTFTIMRVQCNIVSL